MSAKLLGSYESELHGVLGGFLKYDFDRIINIGCAEGYYAVGLARAKPEARVIAYDTNISQRRRTSWLAAANGVLDRIILVGACDESLLARDLQGARSILIVCDVEGAELDFLKPGVFPPNCRAWLVVECHKVNQKWTSEELTTRFELSHRIEQISYQPDSRAESFAWLLDSGFDKRELQIAVREGRELEQHWLIMSPKVK